MGFFRLTGTVTNYRADSDLPLVFELLDIFPTDPTVLDQFKITTMNGTRARHIVTTYVVTFFDWLLRGGSDDLLKSPSLEFPEVSLDTGDTEVFSNGTVIGAVNRTVISRSGSGPSGNENSATPTSTIGKWSWALGSLLGLSLIV